MFSRNLLHLFLNIAFLVQNRIFIIIAIIDRQKYFKINFEIANRFLFCKNIYNIVVLFKSKIRFDLKNFGFLCATTDRWFGFPKSLVRLSLQIINHWVKAIIYNELLMIDM